MREIFHNDAAAVRQTVRCMPYRFIERMNVMERASEEDRIKIATVKIRPRGHARIHAEPSRGGDGIVVAVNRDDGVSIL